MVDLALMVHLSFKTGAGSTPNHQIGQLLPPLFLVAKAQNIKLFVDIKLFGQSQY